MSDYPQAYRCDHRKARKCHECCECGGMIAMGETYHYHHGVWDGQGDDFKICSDCQKLRDKIEGKPKRRDFGKGDAYASSWIAASNMKLSTQSAPISISWRLEDFDEEGFAFGHLQQVIMDKCNDNLNARMHAIILKRGAIVPKWLWDKGFRDVVKEVI